jgi:hypothetical protein
MKNCLILIAVAGLASAASADILMGQQGQGYNNGNGATIGGAGILGIDSDLQACDDFTINDTYNITSVSGDWLTFFGGLPLQGAKVEFFTDNGFGAPGEVPFASYDASQGETSTQNFNDPNFGLIGVTMTVDLSGAGIQLPADTYWVSVQPIAIGGDWGYVTVNMGGGTGQFLRDGGVDHGNGLAGGYGTNDWVSAVNFNGQDGSVGYTVEGSRIPAPGAAAIMGLAGLFAGRRRR